MDSSLVEEALKRGKARREEYPGHRYVRFCDDMRDVPRGTVVFDDTMIWGYPQIGRILSLEIGLREHYAGPFWMEEKIDGYNVRIFRHRDEILALSRGGFICPFTTDRVADLMDTGFFEEHPDVVVCAEVAGPDNPYLAVSPPFVARDVALFVFDMLRVNEPGFISLEEKHTLLARHGLPAVSHFGMFSHQDWDAIKALLARLNDEGREGVVLKSESPRVHRAKYITSSASINDIRSSMSSLHEMPAEFFVNRVLRLAFYLEEEKVADTDAYYGKLGEALLAGLFEAIEQYRATHHVYHRHCCRFRRKENAELLIDFMSHRTREMQVIPRRLEKEGEFYVLEFDKVHPGMTGLISHLLRGGLLFD